MIRHVEVPHVGVCGISIYVYSGTHILSEPEHCFMKSPSAKRVVTVRYAAEKFMPHSPPLHEATKHLQIGN